MLLTERSGQQGGEKATAAGSCCLCATGHRRKTKLCVISFETKTPFYNPAINPIPN